jgi:hypothetical protein
MDYEGRDSSMNVTLGKVDPDAEKSSAYINKDSIIQEEEDREVGDGLNAGEDGKAYVSTKHDLAVTQNNNQADRDSSPETYHKN